MTPTTGAVVLHLDSDRMRVQARDWLAHYGITAHVEGSVLWVVDGTGQRMRADDGDRLVYRDSAFTVERGTVTSRDGMTA